MPTFTFPRQRQGRFYTMRRSGVAAVANGLNASSLARQKAVRAREERRNDEFVAEAPWPGYDDLNVQQVVERLQALEQHDLRSLRFGEVAHKNCGYPARDQPAPY